MKIAFVFPGQGAQTVGMGKDFYDSFAIAKETFQEADDLLKEGLSKIIFEGPMDLLTETRNSQLAIFVVSMALLRTAQQQLPDLIPAACAGLSLGEYTALCASGRLGFKETLLLVRERARLMNEACEKVPGTMAAVLGMSAEQIVEGVKGLQGVWVANFNAPGQTVISGTKEGIEKAGIVLKERGAKRVIPLTVHGAFHSGLMQKAQDGLKPFIDLAQIQDSNIGFVMNVTGDFVNGVDAVRCNLEAQVTQSVKWEQGIEAMKREGIELYLEIGCGKTLTGLNKKIGVASCASIEKINDLEMVHAAT
ncbi:MAG: ACP S-malonyltransferase [Parachlamydiales bacterium]|nr:ACP S-malonyltransferase [Parachlamydiales bacterium]